MTERVRVAIVVLNWNNADDTVACLSSIRQCASSGVDIIAVDNGSTDGSAELIEASGLADIVLRTGANLGYAGGNNAGLEAAQALRPEVIVVLNNDTLVVDDLFDRLAAHLAGVGSLAAISPVITYADDPERMWFAGGVVDRGWPRHLQPDELPARASGQALAGSEILTGCCIAASAETWRLAGGFDERFFLIFEDSDWSLRAHSRGIRLLVAGDCRLEHRVSRSFRAGPMRKLGTYYFVRNGILFHARWARRYLPRFLWQWVMRPTLKRALRRDGDAPVTYAWRGVGAALVGDFGRASASLERCASRPASTS